MKYKTLDLLRHGEPAGGNVFRGRTDHELTELGWQQAQAATEGKTWDLVISSPLSRCHQFAKSLAEKQGIPLVVSEDLQEFDFGVWENQNMETVFKEDFERIKGMWDDPMNFVAPEGESIMDFESRVLKAWFGCLARSEEKILVVCHGGVIRMLLKEVLGLPFKNINRLDVPFACCSQIKINEKEPYHYQLMTHG